MKSKLLAVLASLFAAVTVFAGEFPDISVEDLKKAIADKKAVVIDVNGSDSWKEGHVPTAIDFETKKAELAKLLPADKNALIVAYCGGPSCGAYAAAAKEAKKLGYTNVKHLSAGISGWKKAGEKTEAGKK
jgi:rhodanese-related sulfurtransferase